MASDNSAHEVPAQQQELTGSEAPAGAAGAAGEKAPGVSSAGVAAGQGTENDEPEKPEEDADGAPDPARAPAKKPTTCIVCDASAAKYKCSRCYMPYCSVACSKQHRENHPPDPEPPAATPPTTTKPESEPTVEADNDPRNPFRVLDTSDKLRYLFRKYPNLPEQLQKIHEATLPPQEAPGKSIPASMMQGMARRDGWNHDVGIRNGKEALRRARSAEGPDGDAVREYSELILHLISDGPAARDQGAASILQQKAAKEDAKLIESLMAQEKR